MKLNLVRLDEMAQQPLSEELVPGLLDTGLVMAIAEPGAGKTFFGIHVGVHVAAGLKWKGRKVTQGPVVYCIAEGVNYFTYRITTAFDQLGASAEGAPFYVLPHSMNMRSGDDGEATEELGALVMAITALPETPRLIVFDTLNRYMPGGDENNQKDASALVRGCEFLQQTFGGTVMLMHHMRKGGDLARGSTVFGGAMDQVIFAKKGKGSLTDKPVLWTTAGKEGKRKDRDPVNQWFQFKQVPMSRGNMGKYDPDFDSPCDFYVMKTDYRENGEEYETNVVEETLVMEPCEPPEGFEEDDRSVEAAELLAVVNREPDGLRVRHTMEELGWNTRKFYRAVNELEAENLIEKDEKTGRYHATAAKRTSGNPFAPAG